MYIIVGLGNPGDKYAHTRHNVGFDVVTLLADRLNLRFDKLKCKARIAEGRIGNERVALALPQTYMNLSGESVVQLMNWYKADMDHLIVVYDDIDLEPGRVRFRPSGSAGTHNGMRSIIYLLGRDDFPRVRVGTGRAPAGWDLVDWVLAPYQTPEARKVAYDSYLGACDVIEAYIASGAQAAGDKAREICRAFEGDSPKKPRNVASSRFDFSPVGEAIQKRIDEKYIAGAQCVVTVGGKMAWQCDKGYADIASQTPVSRDTLWRLASMTKPITGVATMILVERGLLDLDAPIDNYLSDVDGRWRVALRDDQGNITGYEPAARPITARDILTHSSGLGQLSTAWDEAVAALPDEEYTLAGIVKASGKVPLDFQPGTQTGYSAIAAMNLLARACEELTGMSYASFLSTEIFTPLGMKSTGYRLTERQWAQTATAYEPYTLAEMPIGKMGYPDRAIYDCASAGLVSSLLDYMRFALMLGGKGQYRGARILKEETVEAMATPQLSMGIPGEPPHETWGLSMRVILDKGEGQPLPKGCFGWSGAYGTHFWIDPKHDLTCTLMLSGNVGGAGSPVSREVEAAVTKVVEAQGRA